MRGLENMEFKINLDDKPNLRSALLNEADKEKAKEVIATFVDAMEQSFAKDGVRWADLPKELHPNLTFNDLILGILHGSLDVKAINPEAYHVLKAEVHPLSILALRKDYLTGEQKQRNWRAHFRLPDGSLVDKETIASIFKTVLRYSKYVSVKQLAEAIDTKQEMTFRGLGSRVVELLPMRPALEYQREHFGDLHVGTFNLDTGGLDCGEIERTDTCPACKKKDIGLISDNMVCLICNSSFKIKN
jgi:hypothetical protein